MVFHSKIISLSFILVLTPKWIATTDGPDCNSLDNGKFSDNPVFKEPDCSYKCFACETENCKNDLKDSSCSLSACSINGKEVKDSKCNVDGYVGSYVIFENEQVRAWNFTLEPGQMTSMHRHDFDYSFGAVKPSQLEVFG